MYENFYLNVKALEYKCIRGAAKKPFVIIHIVSIDTFYDFFCVIDIWTFICS